METRSGSFPPGFTPEIRSESHYWLRTHPTALKDKKAKISYKQVHPNDIPEVKALQEELFPIQYSDTLYNSINDSILSIGAYFYSKFYDEGHTPLLVGVILYRIQKNDSNEHLRWTYMLSTTFSAYVITLGVIEEMRGRGIAKTLISMCIQSCEENSPTPLYIALHVADYNDEAIPFYEKLGFELMETLNSHYYIENEYYGAYLYVYYFQSAKKPLATWNNFSSMVNLIPKCIKTLTGFIKFPKT